MPSSTTAICWPCTSSVSDNGSPMWLLRLPRLRYTSVRGREQIGGDFLRRRLAGAASDRDDARAGSAADLVAKALKRRERVPHLDNGRAARDRDRVGHQHARRAARERRVDERVPVEPVALERNEQRAPIDRPAVGRDAAENLRVGPGDHASFGRARDHPGSQHDGAHNSRHTREAARRCPRAARATSTSSNGSVRSPMI